MVHQVDIEGGVSMEATETGSLESYETTIDVLRLLLTFDTLHAHDHYMIKAVLGIVAEMHDLMSRSSLSSNSWKV